MSMPPPYGWGASPADPRFHPADPLVSPDYAGWWQRGFAVLRRGWRPLTLVQLLVAVPTLILLIPAQLFFDLSTRPVTGDPIQVGSVLTASGLSLLALIAATVVYAIGALASVRLVVTIATGGDARVGRALRAVLHRVPAMAGWSVLAGLLVIGAILACVLPVLYVGAVLVVLPAVVLFERGGIARCFALFHTDLGAAISRAATVGGLGLAITLVFAFASILVTLAVHGSAFADPTVAVSAASVVTESVASSVLTGVASLVCGVVLTPLIVATYTDLRARREPFTTAQLPPA